MTESFGKPCLFEDWPAALITVSGNDRARFLHNMCTADVVAMQSGDVREALFTNVKGHVLSHAVVYAERECIRVLILQQDATPLAEHLDRYIIREDVELVVATTRPKLIVGAESAPDANSWHRFPVSVPNAWVCWTGDTTAENISDLEIGGAADFDTVRVISLWPVQGVDFQAGALPQELSRDRLAISFTKGCYLGQETVARIDALGHVNKYISLVEGEQLAPEDELNSGDRAVGILTTVAKVEDQMRGIAMLRRGSETPGKVLQSGSGNATVLTAPYASS